MPVYLTPGIYVEEVPGGARPIQAVGTSTAGFVGEAPNPNARVNEAVAAVGHHVPNTAVIERRNGTARLMNITQVRKSLAFSRNPDAKEALGWWSLTVYNWCREHRMLKVELEQPVGKKSINSEHQRWRLV